MTLGGIIMLSYLKEEANLTTTENGALTYRSTTDYCLDLFATIGAMRPKKKSSPPFLWLMLKIPT